jgi:hypothetical protein
MTPKQDCPAAGSVAGDGCPVLTLFCLAMDCGPVRLRSGQALRAEFCALEPSACGCAGHTPEPAGREDLCRRRPQSGKTRMPNRAEQSQFAMDSTAANYCSERRLGERHADHAAAKTKSIYCALVVCP